MATLDPPLVPKRGNTLSVLMICRVSDPGEGKQRVESNDEQEHRLRSYLSDIWSGQASVRVIAGTGSGEWIERVELAEAEAAVESGDVDLVLCEDLGRIARRYHAQAFCELAEDHDTRVVAVNGDVDTGRANWRTNAGIASLRHELYNADTAQRIRRSHQGIFDKGGLIQHTIFGYVKPPGAKNDAQLQKDPKAEPIYAEWFRRLKDGASFAEIADWLNAQGVSVGPCCRSQRWTSVMVGRLTRNPLLKGVRERNRKVSRRVNRTGKYVAVTAPVTMLRTRAVPHLALVEADLFDEVGDLIRRRNANYRRAKEGQRDPRAGMPRKRTIWPSQRLICGVCGRPMLCYGKANHRLLMCSGAAKYKCWNSVAPSLEMINAKLMLAISDLIENLPEFDEALQRRVAEKLGELYAKSGGRQRELKARLADLEAQASRLTNAVAQNGDLVSLADKLRDVEADKAAAERELRCLRRSVTILPELPSMATLKMQVREELATIAADSPELGRMMARLVPSLHAFPYRLADDGRVVLRAMAVIDLSAMVDGVAEMPEVRERLVKEVIVDLFDQPQREQHRQRVWQLTNSGTGIKEREIGAKLGITQPAVQRAKSLQRLLDSLNRTDAYVPVTLPPAQSRLLRHSHPRYRFDPLVGYPLVWPTL